MHMVRLTAGRVLDTVTVAGISGEPSDSSLEVFCSSL